MDRTFRGMMDYRAYPTQREAAAMLRVSASTLSRKRLGGVRLGRRELRLPPVALLEAARANNWVPAESLAQTLVNYTQVHCPEAADQVSAQIKAWFEGKPALDREAFLAEAARALPPGLFDAILVYYPPVASPGAPDAMADQESVPGATQEGGS